MEKTMEINTKKELRELAQKNGNKKFKALVAVALIVNIIQSRKETIPSVVAKYHSDMLAGAQFPPAKACVDAATGIFWVWDGNHTYQALLLLGATHMWIEFSVGSERDARLEAFGANDKHGQPQDDDDRENSLRQLLKDEEWGRLSSTRLAKIIRSTIKFVEDFRAIFEEENGLVQPGAPRVREVTRNGVTYLQKLPPRKPKAEKGEDAAEGDPDLVANLVKYVARKFKKFDIEARARFTREIAPVLADDGTTA